MNRRTVVFAFAIAGAVLVASVLLCRDIARTAGLGFISYATGLVFPPGCIDVEVFDSGEFFSVAHLRIPMGRVDGFMSENAFTDSSVAVVPWIETLGPQNREIPGNARLVSLEGSRENNTWLCSLDRDTGRLWIVVFYPDPAGTSP
ncbi:MAG: hypothetical protein R6V62_08245 [Candidatus Fermentibacteraceae bacterium]